MPVTGGATHLGFAPPSTAMLDNHRDTQLGSETTSRAQNLSPGVNTVIIVGVAQIMLHCICACAKASI